MNRSVLLVICDFLILTLLSFVEFDAPTPAVGAAAPGETRPAVSAPAMSNMLTTLEMALESERERRGVLSQALTATQAELEQRRSLIEERERHLSEVQGRLEMSEAEARRLAEERGRLEQRQSEALASVQALHQAFEVTQRNTDTLRERLTDSTREAAEATTRLRTLEEDLARQREEAEAMRRRIAVLDETREALNEEKRALAMELRQTEVEARAARMLATNLNEQLATVGREKAELLETTSRLATNITVISEQSSAIRTEIERHTEQAGALREQIERQVRLPANAIYGEFLSNRVELAVAGTTRGGFGQEVVRRRETGMVFVRDGERVYGLVHVDAIPLRLWPPEAVWTGFSAEVTRGGAVAGLPGFSLLARDPRMVVIPVDPAVPGALGVRVYEAVGDPSEFGEAVVIGGGGTNYGECQFRLVPHAPGYVQMERSTFRRWMGDFAPRKGDLAFTRTGLFLGILVNGDHCLLPGAWETLPEFRCGERLDPAANTAVLRAAQAVVERLPGALK